MTFSIVDISFPADLLVQIDQIAGMESRTRDVLVSDAVKMYIERKIEKKLFNEKCRLYNNR